jgi:hypothetical protein
MPGSISSFQVNGKTYIASANEGESESLMCSTLSPQTRFTALRGSAAPRHNSSHDPVSLLFIGYAHAGDARDLEGFEDEETAGKTALVPKLRVTVVPLPKSKSGEVYTYGARRRVTILVQVVELAAIVPRVC